MKNMKFLVLSTLIFATAHATLILGGKRMVSAIVANDDGNCSGNCVQFGEYQIEDGSCVASGDTTNCATATTGGAEACGAITANGTGACTWTAAAAKHHVTFDWRPTLTSVCLKADGNAADANSCGANGSTACDTNDRCVATPGNAHTWVRGVREISAEQADLDHVKFVDTAGVTVTREYFTCIPNVGASGLCAQAMTDAACSAASMHANAAQANDSCQWTASTGMHWCMVSYCTSGSGRCYTSANLSAETASNACCGGGATGCPCSTEALCVGLGAGSTWDKLNGDNCYNGDERKCAVCTVGQNYAAPITCAKRRRALLGDRYEEHEEWLKTMKWTEDTHIYLDHAVAPEL